MIEKGSYWSERVGTRLSRRRWLTATGAVGAGALAMGLSGCGSGSKSSAPGSGGASLLNTPVDTTASWH